MNFTALLLSVVLAVPVAAQGRSDDSLAVISTVQRYYVALERGDTVTVNGLLSPKFIFIQRAEIRALAAMQGEDGIVGLVRWHQQTARGPRTLHARLSPQMAYVWTSADFSSTSRPDLFKGTEVELLVLTRLGQTWLIEAVHGSLKDRE
jgi:hypothetical protein